MNCGANAVTQALPKASASHETVGLRSGPRRDGSGTAGRLQNCVDLPRWNGRNLAGRLRVAAEGADLGESAQAFEVATLLKGDNSAAACARLVRQHATSGVSGVVPKLPDAQQAAPARLAAHRRTSLVSHRHIIKGPRNQPASIALNEHLCLQVVARVMLVAGACKPSANRRQCCC